MICRACGLDHAAYGFRPGDQCGRVRYVAAMRQSSAPVDNRVANIAPPAPVGNSGLATKPPRHGDRHAKTEARKLYMRELMRRRRAAP